MPEPEQWHEGGKGKPEKLSLRTKVNFAQKKKVEYQHLVHQKCIKIR